MTTKTNGPSEWAVRQEICEIGRRIYARQFAAGNDGNISYRLHDDLVLCTPTQVCKGFMKPDDLCVVDLKGRQVAGKKKPTSETAMHLEVYRGDPKVRAVVHCHPPHATAFGMAGEDIPTCVLPEVEVFLGVVPRANYATPGGNSFADSVRPFLGKANTVVLSNHGTVSWGPTVERAYWHTEILDSYCRMLILARQLGKVRRIPEGKVNELLDLREAFGSGTDNRRVEGGELCVNPRFGVGEGGKVELAEVVEGGAAGGVGGAGGARACSKCDGACACSGGDQADLVKAITERVMAALEAKG
ncbi:MAG: class II aldolase/adducin family protein [Planctomycetes bacterium]|nr:class II aldolase/adducin family protein [Planctomycetota bacterium]